LCLSSEFESCPKYATLSHCWGSTKFLTLKSGNLQLFREKVPDEAIFRTFEDAIYITKELGIQYLWIDSLCILQDDSDDWRRESALMSGVYGGSTINIAASGAVDGGKGCLNSNILTWMCQVEAGTTDEKRLFDCVPGHMYYQSLTCMPLPKRGWAFQERLLPSRTLHFTST
jgi:hypothetical protein